MAGIVQFNSVTPNLAKPALVYLCYISIYLNNTANQKAKIMRTRHGLPRPIHTPFHVLSRERMQDWTIGPVSIKIPTDAGFRVLGLLYQAWVKEHRGTSRLRLKTQPRTLDELEACALIKQKGPHGNIIYPTPMGVRAYEIEYYLHEYETTRLIGSLVFKAD